MDTIDTRGLSCPQPVIMVTNAVSDGKAAFEVLTDSECSLENITRLLESKKYKYEIIEKDEYKIIKAAK
ncbi:MAG: sulfurtransferase TusA family protein [Candidatus Delongbacteria bacterium]|nr:sulfurtransferase TusA family protein [Candidatus Delongbacteria bacterium]MCG2761522.1 sulfurtransferase TusA family protein [Candidatus Delongbacteria bacterium]